LTIGKTAGGTTEMIIQLIKTLARSKILYYYDYERFIRRKNNNRMTEDYKQFDTAKTDSAPIIPELIKHIYGFKFTEVVLTVAIFVISLVCVVFVILYSTGKSAVIVEERVCVSAPTLFFQSYQSVATLNVNKAFVQ
jgi:hypothetical protein